MIRAAGILIISKEGKGLFVQRSASGDLTGSWEIPGGKLEEGEDSLAAAIRETFEETKFKAPKAKLTLWTRRIWAPPVPDAVPGTLAAMNPTPVDFTTYILRGVDEFIPELNEEHSAYAWAPLDQPPQPLHPGMDVTLRRFAMNELDIAKAIRDGELTSPQWYENIALFAIRITGTGMAARFGGEEIAVRDPAHYLTPEFLERCNGLPVILQHPKEVMLDTDEYRERNIGTCVLPYIKDDEVWSIAKIYDEPSALMMESTPLSTSPAVVWREGNAKTVNIDGQKFLVEGNPNLLDHIAICPQGVWDKGGGPTGVQAVRGDEDMEKTEFEKWIKEQDEKFAKLRADSTESINGLTTLVSNLADGIKALVKRADADDEKKEEEKRSDARRRADNFKFSGRKDGESDEDLKSRRDAEEEQLRKDEEEAGESKEMAADKARKRRDAQEEDEEKERADSARRADEERRAKLDLARGDDVDTLKKQLEELRGQIPRQMSDQELNDFSRVQSRADNILTNFGGRARAPLLGESLIAYRRHFVNSLKEHSPRWKDVDLTVVAASDAVFGNIEEEVLRDAHAASTNPATVKPGELRMRTHRADSGHTIHTFEGHPSAWMDPIAGHVKQYAREFKTARSNVN